MRVPGPGWRSARWRLGAHGMAASTTGTELAAPFPGAVAAGLSAEPAQADWPWKGVQWNLSLLGFLYFVWTITTYHAVKADIGMIVALLCLPFQRQKITIPPFLIFLGVFFLAALVSYTMSEYPTEAQEGVIAFGKIWLIALVGVNVLRTREQVRFFLFFFLAAFALYPLRGAFVNMIFGITEWGRVGWNFIYENPNDLAAFSFLPLGMAAAVAMTETNKVLRWCGRAGVGMISLMMFFTQSRGALLALIITALMTLLGEKKKMKYLAVLGGLTVIVLIFAPSSVWERLSGLTQLADDPAQLRTVDPEGSAYQRYMLWQVAFDIIKEHPVTGIGPGAYKIAHALTARAHGFPVVTWGLRDTHSTYINTLTEVGVLGFLPFLGVFISAVWAAERARRRAKRVLPTRERQLWFMELGLLAFGLSCVFGTYTDIPFTYLFVIVLAVLSARVNEELNPAALVGGRRR